METAADFVEGFRRYWSAPSLDGLSALLAPDVTFVQPLAPRMHGLDEVRRQFGAIFAWLPDLRAEVDRWSSAGNVVFIEFRLRATIGGRLFEWPVIDRFLLRDDGLAVEVGDALDPMPLLARRRDPPVAWRQLWRSGAATALLRPKGRPDAYRLQL
ncbi:MAG TPA: nuclear transport factor 2 family protein [Verrucomicrobiae bacterium]|nr:nuclear transport factor 2 family protein [Verrucomicrobiae bacterium]